MEYSIYYADSTTYYKALVLLTLGEQDDMMLKSSGGDASKRLGLIDRILKCRGEAK